jgi:hypothetical protein
VNGFGDLMLGKLGEFLHNPGTADVVSTSGRAWRITPDNSLRGGVPTLGRRKGI